MTAPTKPSDDSGNGVQALLQRPAVLLAVILLGGSAGPVGTAKLFPDLYRPDGITRTTVLQLLCLVEWDLRKDNPTAATRTHILALHEAMRKIDSTYRPPMTSLQDGDAHGKTCETLLAELKSAPKSS